MFLCEKKQRNQGKSLIKIYKNSDLRHIFGTFGRKKIFSKIGLGHILNIPNAHLCAKNQEKLIMKSQEIAKKPVFAAYFWYFWPENYVFLKIGL